jgi:hypothetical protein
MAIMAAQGRSLGFSLVFATQDIPAMLRENDKEAKSIIANTTTKIFMRVEELEMTAKLAVESGGKGMKAQVGGFSGKSGETHMSYLDDMSARLEVVDRISALDLRALGVGEAYITWHDQYFKVKTFHAYPEGQYKDLGNLQLRVNHFIAVARPNPVDVKKEETLPLIAEKLVDARFAQIIEKRAKDERATIEKAALEKRDPAKMKFEIACGAVAYLRCKGKGSQSDLLTAACASIAAITLAQINDANAFTKEVRRVEGLPDAAPAAPKVSAGVARSGKARVPSEIPTAVTPASRAAAAARDAAHAGDDDRIPAGFGTGADPVRRPARAAPPNALRELDDEVPPPDEMDFENDADDMAVARSTAGILDALDRTSLDRLDPARAEAQRSEAPSKMRKVEHGATVDNSTFKMAEKIQANDATLRFLDALNFDADPDNEPGEAVVNTAIEEAIYIDEEPATAPDPHPAEIERADVASARATQWTERGDATKPRTKEPVPDLEDAVRSGNVEDMTASFLADLLEDED